MKNNIIVDEDLDNIIARTQNLWEELRGQKIFITGGTGFFGAWLLKSFGLANTKFELGASALVLTRDANGFKKRFTDIAADGSIKFLTGDVKNFQFPDGQFGYIIHAAATSATETFNNADILQKFDTVVGGTRHVLDFAVHCGAKKILYTSSGVVYGKLPPEINYVNENYNGAPDPSDTSTLAAWGTSKRAAEFLCAYYSQKYNLETKIARCFTFIGPGLPLDIHYAAGNFISDALAGKPIQILGDGSPRRSYLYTSDLMVWLWTILFRGQPNYPYNVGSEKDLSIADLAQAVSDVCGGVEINIAQPHAPNSVPDCYVPSTNRAQKELGLKEIVPLKQAIVKTVTYLKSN
jgi:dTDP-glucose 4,6-dehydratase